MTQSGLTSPESEADRLRRQRALLARFGELALRTDDLDVLLQHAADLVAEAINADFVKIVQLLPGGDNMLVRAGVHWSPGVVGRTVIGAHDHSPGGFALESAAPVLANDLTSEARFDIPELLIEHGVTSSASVPIRGHQTEWGALAADSRQGGKFDEDDIIFLQNCANLLAPAIERLQLDAELAAAAERNKRLLNELEHRATNLIANVLALAQRTRAKSADLDEFGEAFEARLSALLRAQRLLTQGQDEDISIWTLLRCELQAHGAQEPEDVELSGPDVMLPAKIAQALSMAFHELATNAVKYGPLGRTAGRIHVSWSVVASSEGDEVQIRWRETGVDIASAPSRRGFGSDLIERILPAMLGGKCALIFHPDGAECTIQFPRPAA